jgi:hypothetical protein
VRCGLWKVWLSVVGLRERKGENEGLCLEGDRLRYNFLFTVWKFLQGLRVNETHRTVAETVVRKSERCHTSIAGGLAGENGAWEKWHIKLVTF